MSYTPSASKTLSFLSKSPEKTTHAIPDRIELKNIVGSLMTANVICDTVERQDAALKNRPSFKY